MDWIEWTLTSTSFCTKHARSTESVGILVFVGGEMDIKTKSPAKCTNETFSCIPGSDCLYFFDVFEEGVKFFKFTIPAKSFGKLQSQRDSRAGNAPEKLPNSPNRKGDRLPSTMAFRGEYVNLRGSNELKFMINFFGGQRDHQRLVATPGLDSFFQTNPLRKKTWVRFYDFIVLSKEFIWVCFFNKGIFFVTKFGISEKKSSNPLEDV